MTRRRCSSRQSSHNGFPHQACSCHRQGDLITGFIAEPRRINPLLRLAIWYVERGMRQRFVPGRLLGWYPRAALGFVVQGLLEASHHRTLSDRILALVGIAASYAVGSPYCIAANSEGHQRYGISDAELDVIRAAGDLSEVTGFTPRERLAITYARLISATPLVFPDDFVAELKAAFSAREIVVLASSVAYINLLARLIEPLGVPPPVFSDQRPGR